MNDSVLSRSRPVAIGGLMALSMVIAATGCRETVQDRAPAVAPVAGTLELDGLAAPVRVVRDTWGVPHIYAANQDDLFFAQGFVQAGDRLFQMDLWRRAAQGRLAEVLGANFVSRDAMTRRVQYRGSIDAEWASYGADTQAIATAFVRGVNAWVAVAREQPTEEFTLAGWLPEPWRPEDLLNRTDAFVASGDAAADVFRAQLVTAVGPARAAALLGASEPLAIPPGLDLPSVTFQIADALRQIGTAPFFAALHRADGSNAWAVPATRSASGAPLLAADPHRPLTNPALRYLVHLTAPGWNVAGATAAWLPGVAIGHNDRMAWGMTAFNADTADLYVERVNPDNSHQIQIDGAWRNTTVVTGSIGVNGRPKPVPYEREYTPHGVIIGNDRERHLAFALRWSGNEAGGAGELAALALNRAQSTAEFQEALSRWKMPSVEVVYAERGGGIGSRVAAQVPVRSGWDGRLPAAGWLGGTEWTGWRTGDALSSGSDGRPPAPAVGANGYVAAANGNRARTERLRALLSSGTFSVEAFEMLQHDVRASNAERLLPLFERIRTSRPDVEEARRQLLAWNRQIDADSAAAALYVAWERLVLRLLVQSRVPGPLVDEFVSRSPNLLVPALTAPSRVWFDGDASRARDRLIVEALEAAVGERTAAAGVSPPRNAAGPVIFAHPLAITDAARRRFNVGPFERPKYGDMLMSTSGVRPEAMVGASFAVVFDLADWDRSTAQNAPGQSESPESAHYADLATLWSERQYFPLPFSEGAVAAAAESTLTLTPRRSTQNTPTPQSGN